MKSILSVIVSAGIAIGTAFAIIKLIRKKREKLKRDLEFRRQSEIETEKDVGLGEVAKAESRVESYEEEAQKKESEYKSSEVLEESHLKGYKGAIKGVKAVEEGAEAAWHESSAEKATAAMEASSIGITAALKKIIEDLIEYTSKKKSNILTEEHEGLALEKLIEDIKSPISAQEIEQNTSSYLKGFLAKLASSFKQDIEIERKKKDLLVNLSNELEKMIGIITRDIKDAKTESENLRSEEKKTQKSFKKELKDFEASLKAESKQIDEMGRSKNVNQTITVSLIKEMELRSEQLESAKNLNRQIESAYTFMKLEVRQMKKLLNNILSTEKEIAKYSKSMKKRKRQINSRLEDLTAALTPIEKIAGTELKNPHTAALSISSKLRLYFKKYAKILEEDLSFDETIKEMLIKKLAIAQQIEAFQKLATALTESEKAVLSGVQTLTGLVSGAAGAGSKKDVEGIVQTLKNSTKVLDYEKSIESLMKKLAQRIKDKIKQLNEDIQALIDEDKKLLAKIRAEEESSSSHINKLALFF